MTSSPGCSFRQVYNKSTCALQEREQEQRKRRGADTRPFSVRFPVCFSFFCRQDNKENQRDTCCHEVTKALPSTKRKIVRVEHESFQQAPSWMRPAKWPLAWPLEVSVARSWCGTLVPQKTRAAAVRLSCLSLSKAFDSEKGQARRDPRPPSNFTAPV